MSHTPHELVEEFPEYKDRIHDLKTSDAHFRRLFDAYHEVNREVHRTEAAGINVADTVFEDMKKRRLALKDDLFALLKGERI